MKGRGLQRPSHPEREETSPYQAMQITPDSGMRSEAVNELLQAVFHYRFGPSLSLESDSGAGFTFEGEQHYEALGTYVNAFVFCLLKEIAGLVEVWLPANNPQYCVLQSQDWTSNSNKAMVLLPGKGKVGLGQWSRRICVNEGLNAGSMLGYVTRAQAEGYSVLVMNCNARTSTLATNESNAEATWNTSSLTPQINLHWPDASPDKLSFPMSMRPQAHDIIRTWAFVPFTRTPRPYICTRFSPSFRLIWSSRSNPFMGFCWRSLFLAKKRSCNPPSIGEQDCWC